jgi:uncharacterized protein (TIGR02246 family)
MRYLVLACTLAVGCGGRSHKDTTPVAGDAMDAAHRAAETWRQAYEARSVDGVAALYAHDASLVLVEQGVAFTGWDAASAHLKAMLGHAREIHVKLNDVRVGAVDDDVVVVVAAMDREVSDGTLTTSERGILTLVLHRESDGWRVVSEHYSYPHTAS